MVAALLALVLSAPLRGDASLEAFVQQQLRAHHVPGASVAVIRENRIVWLGAFGVANTLTRRRVTTDTAFPVASNGKPVAAYIALRLASLGVIDPDRPVLQQAAVDLPPSPAHRQITPLHLLTHSSGLGNFLRDRRRNLNFRPGERFSYSGVGFVVLQELLERRTGQTLDELASVHLFQPAHMRHSWFGVRPPAVAAVAAGHVSLLNAVAPFTIVVTPLILAIGSLFAIVTRFRSGRWSLDWRLMTVAVVLAGLLAFGFLLNRSGTWVLSAWFSMVAAVMLTAVTALCFAIWRRRGMFRLSAGAILLVGVAGVLVALPLPVPLPTSETGPANAASTLRATASDLATFMIELSRPQRLDAAVIQNMTRVHQPIDDRSGWGLGIGIERHARGRDLWHWGSNPGAKSIMILCPETGDGVVVLTNGSEGSVPMRNIAEHVMRRKGCWRPGCTSGD